MGDAPRTTRSMAAWCSCQPSDRLTGERLPRYAFQVTTFNSVISSTAYRGPSRPVPLIFTPP